MSRGCGGCRRLQHPLEDGWTLPASWYSEPSVLELERERVFASVLAVRRPCRARRRNRASFFASEAGHIPVVVTRAVDGELRGFVNVCRHRGHVVAEGSGCRETLQCPYHAWTYELDGTLRRAPRSEREPGFDASALLAAPRLGRHLGTVRLRQPRSRRVAAVRGARRPAGDVARSGLDLDGLRFHSHVPWEQSRELEGRAGELPRVLPLPGGASRFQQGDRRRPRRLSARGRRAGLEPGRPVTGRGRGRRHAPVPVPLPLAEHDHQHLAGPAERLDRALGADAPRARPSR